MALAKDKRCNNPPTSNICMCHSEYTMQEAAFCITRGRLTYMRCLVTDYAVNYENELSESTLELRLKEATSI